MKRSLIPFLCAALILWTALGAAEAVLPAAEVEVRLPSGFVCRTANGRTEAEIIGYEGTDMRVTTPASVTFPTDEGDLTLPVTRLKAWAFEKSPVSAVVIAEGVTEIGAYCFSECESLEVVVLPESLQVLGSCAFIRCISLEEIALPAALTAVGSNPFCYCTGLVRLDLAQPMAPEGEAPRHPVLDFADGMLSERATGRLIARLSTAEDEEGRIALPEGCVTVGDYALANNSALREVEVPDTVTGFGRYAFYHCTALRRVTIPDSVKVIGDGCFRMCHDDLTLSVSEGSPAWTWARANGILTETPGGDAAEPEDDGPFLEETDVQAP